MNSKNRKTILTLPIAVVAELQAEADIRQFSFEQAVVEIREALAIEKAQASS